MPDQVPAHLPTPANLACREPLAPVDVGAWDRGCLQGLAQWEAGDAPFTTVAALAPPALGPGSALAGAGLLAGGGFAADPAVAAVLQAIAGARRGLIVAAELTSPEDVVAAAQLSQLLGWPVAADVLSGLRAGVPGAAAAAAGGGGGGAADPAVVHHMDQLLLLDRRHWPALRPDVVLQLGGHLTSKRLAQFLEWACLQGDAGGGASASPSSGGGGSSGAAGSAAAGTTADAAAPLRWVLADRSPKRHDQSHLLSHRLQAPLPLLAAAVAQQAAASAASGGAAGGAAAAAARQAAAAEQARYRGLLLALDAQASAAVDAALAAMPELTEPAVARTLARRLPPGEGLFVGNSMPIRDLDMYAAPALAEPAAPAAPAAPGPAAAPPAASAAVQGVAAQGLGAPVAANRGASGIDGVLSTGVLRGGRWSLVGEPGSGGAWQCISLNRVLSAAFSLLG